MTQHITLYRHVRERIGGAIGAKDDMSRIAELQLCDVRRLGWLGKRRLPGPYDTRDSTCAIVGPVGEPRIVVGTNVLAGSLIGVSGHNRTVLRACFEGQVQPIIGDRLFL